MRKRKDAMALFELIGPDKVRPPDRAGSPMAVAEASPPPPTAAPAAPVAPAPRPAMPTAPRPAAPVHQSVVAAMTQAAGKPAPPQTASGSPVAARFEPLLAAMGRPVLVTLKLGHAIAVGAALVILLVVVFVLGRASVDTAPDSGPVDDQSMAATLGQTQAPPVGTDEQAPARPAAALPKRIPGKYYLVIQTTSGANPEQDALEVARWLVSHGEPAQAVKIGKQFCVISLTAFDSRESPEIDGYAKTIEMLGKQYRGEGGQYNLSQTVNGVMKPWFYREP